MKKISGLSKAVLSCLTLIASAPVFAATIQGRIDVAGLPAKVMAVRNDDLDKGARWGTLDKFGTIVNPDGAYEIKELETGTYDLAIGVYFPGAGWAAYTVVGLSLKSGLSSNAVKDGIKPALQKICGSIKTYSRNHDRIIEKEIFSGKFANDSAIKLISPFHDKKVFIDTTIDEITIRGLAADTKKANTLLKLKCATKGTAQVPLYAESYLNLVNENGTWKISASRMLWLSREEYPAYPAQYTLNEKLVDISLPEETSNSSGHDYRFTIPLIKIINPKDDVSSIAATNYTIEGSIISSSGGKIIRTAVDLMNRSLTDFRSLPLTVKPNGHFSCPVQLRAGRNELQIWAEGDKRRRVATGVFVIVVEEGAGN